MQLRPVFSEIERIGGDTVALVCLKMNRKPAWEDGKKYEEVILPDRAARFSADLTAHGKRCLPLESNKVRLEDLIEADVCIVSGDPFYQLIRPASEIVKLGFQRPVFIEITKEEAVLPRNANIARERAVQLGMPELLEKLVYLSRRRISPRELVFTRLLKLGSNGAKNRALQEAAQVNGVRKPSRFARELIKLWGLEVAHALYSRTGEWYHQLKRFPGALLDDRGYVIFESEASYLACPDLRRKKDLRVPGGIASIIGYTLYNPENSVPVTYEQMLFEEGERRLVVQSRIERNSASRAACLAVHGTACAVCGFEFGKVYGMIGEGFIHAHHLNPVSTGIREVDPVADMRPLCPNCHAMAHREEPPISIERLKEFIRQNA